MPAAPRFDRRRRVLADLQLEGCLAEVRDRVAAREPAQIAALLAGVVDRVLRGELAEIAALLQRLYDALRLAPGVGEDVAGTDLLQALALAVVRRVALLQRFFRRDLVDDPAEQRLLEDAPLHLGQLPRDFGRSEEH